MLIAICNLNCTQLKYGKLRPHAESLLVGEQFWGKLWRLRDEGASAGV
jgi:hypothetical protein